MRRHLAGLTSTALGAAVRPTAGEALQLLRGRGVTTMTVAGATARAPLLWAAGASAALRAFHARATSHAAAPGPSPHAPTPAAQMQDDFLSGTSAAYLESLEVKP